MRAHRRSPADIRAAAEAAAADGFIRALPDGYDSFLGERGTRLSGGQQKRSHRRRLTNHQRGYFRLDVLHCVIALVIRFDNDKVWPFII